VGDRQPVALELDLRSALLVDQLQHLDVDALTETLRTYLDSDLDVSRTAQALYIHPNTVRYRMRRISDLTGLDTQSFSGLVELLTIARLSESAIQ
jgi:DNA-binding PucR family transcriptional regulator